MGVPTTASEVPAMNRLVTALVATILAAGCTSGAGGASTNVELAVAHVDHLSGTPAEAGTVAAALNAFGLDLYERLAAGGDGNLVMSPASIAVALSMARAGARGTTADEMDVVLHGRGADASAAGLAALDSALNARTGRFADMSGEPHDVTLRIVNAPFAQRGLALEQPYLEALGGRFGAGLRLVDYRAAPDQARLAINRWVGEQTEQRISELLAAGSIDSTTRLVLANAIYLKAAWQWPFADDGTAPGPFTLPDGSSVDAPLMKGGGKLPYAARDGWQAVQLPYVGEKLALLVILPDDLARFERGLDEPLLAGVVDALEVRDVSLTMPRFSAESKVELGTVLADLGMPTAFSDRADFSGITTEEALFISAVVHQANIDVDEKGTEAAAATAVVMAASAAPGSPVALTVDRPFVFALRDLETGAVLFLGRITNPAA